MKLADPILALALTLALFISCASADTIVVESSPGGIIEQFVERFQELAKSGDDVVIDGPCLSACTLALGCIPSNHLFFTKRAVLGFHEGSEAGSDGDTEVPAPETITFLMQHYPAPVQQWIKAHGGLTRHMIFLKGAELAKMFSNNMVALKSQPDSGQSV
jgi:hypothetical protein